MIWSLIPQRLKLICAAILAAFLLAAGSYQLGKYVQRQHLAVDAAKASVKAYQERAVINGEVQNMDAVSLCIELGGLQSDCEQLRGLAAN